MEEITTKYITSRILQYYASRRFFVATECWTENGCIADVLALDLNNNNLHEVEVKISVNDLNQECKKQKYTNDKIHHICSNYHYFAVPEYIKEDALEIINDRHKDSGLIVIYEDRAPLIEKIAKKFHGNYYHKLGDIMLYRATQDLVKYYPDK